MRYTNRLIGLLCFTLLQVERLFQQTGQKLNMLIQFVFDFVERTKLYDKFVRHCCRFWQQSRCFERCFDIGAGVDGALDESRKKTH